MFATHRLPTAAACVQTQVKSFGIYGGQSGAEAGFREHRFPLLGIHSTNCSTIIIIIIHNPGLQ
jgi:hypothetical protein